MTEHEKAEMAEKYPWIDPTLGYPKNTLIDGVSKWERYLAVKKGGAHKSIAWYGAVWDGVLDNSDGEDWELYFANLRGTVNGVEYFWGSFVLGLGLINLMVPAEFTRELTADEKERWSKKNLAIYGMHSGEKSYDVPAPVFED